MNGKKNTHTQSIVSITECYTNIKIKIFSQLDQLDALNRRCMNQVSKLKSFLYNYIF